MGTRKAKPIDAYVHADQQNGNAPEKIMSVLTKQWNECHVDKQGKPKNICTMETGQDPRVHTEHPNGTIHKRHAAGIPKSKHRNDCQRRNKK